MINYNVLVCNNEFLGFFRCPICGVNKEVIKVENPINVSQMIYPQGAFECPNGCFIENGIEVLGKGVKKQKHKFKK